MTRHNKQQQPLSRVLTIKQWCDLSGFSPRTASRLLRRGDGPRVVQLSERRIGIRESDAAEWLAGRVR